MFSLLIIVILTCLLSLVNYPISSDWDLRYIDNPLLNSSQFTSHTSPFAHVRAGSISHSASFRLIAKPGYDSVQPGNLHVPWFPSQLESGVCVL